MEFIDIFIVNPPPPLLLIYFITPEWGELWYGAVCASTCASVCQ